THPLKELFLHGEKEILKRLKQPKQNGIKKIGNFDCNNIMETTLRPDTVLQRQLIVN
ncbi:hypothetical protein LCGC14_2314110, partial [marine sediment metagenome]